MVRITHGTYVQSDIPTLRFISLHEVTKPYIKREFDGAVFVDNVDVPELNITSTQLLVRVLLISHRFPKK